MCFVSGFLHLSILVIRVSRMSRRRNGILDIFWALFIQTVFAPFVWKKHKKMLKIPFLLLAILVTRITRMPRWRNRIFGICWALFIHAPFLLRFRSHFADSWICRNYVFVVCVVLTPAPKLRGRFGNGSADLRCGKHVIFIHSLYDCSVPKWEEW